MRDFSYLYCQDILAYNGEESADSSLPFPIIADSKRELAVALGMLDPVEKDKDGMPLTARCVSLQIKFGASYCEKLVCSHAYSLSLLSPKRCLSLAPIKG